MAKSGIKWVDEEWRLWVAHLTICPQEKKVVFLKHFLSVLY